ncbi:hypothetical protein [Candidatus Berkiella aquae]|uniref:Uncharacterized protein n=1 Tax=Candidatus Berkiella aquae TaxID=295108 RepID=A0A0Q9YZB7_9GAMM|nr:hypothetical protein [Candidatus Berkiella aquae]MCS5712427.1 hypothetical protein [Candidatus Berkiella aquae]
MLDFFKNKAIAAKNYVVDTTTETAEWYGDMRVTPREKIVATLGGIAGVGAAWAAFTLGFGSAPITALTLGITPLATTAITGLAVGTGLLAKKLAGGAINLVVDKLEDYAATEGKENSFIARRLATGYEQPADVKPSKDFGHYKAKFGDLEADESKGLLADLKNAAVQTFMRASLTRGRHQGVEYRDLPTYTQMDLDKVQEATTRSGRNYRNVSDFNASVVRQDVRHDARQEAASSRTRSGRKYQ